MDIKQSLVIVKSYRMFRMVDITEVRCYVMMDIRLWNIHVRNYHWPQTGGTMAAYFCAMMDIDLSDIHAKNYPPLRMVIITEAPLYVTMAIECLLVDASVLQEQQAKVKSTLLPLLLPIRLLSHRIFPLQRLYILRQPYRCVQRTVLATEI
jgi:hypothetical protein